MSRPINCWTCSELDVQLTGRDGQSKASGQLISLSSQQLEAYEVDAAYIRALREAGWANLTVQQLIALKKGA